MSEKSQFMVKWPADMHDEIRLYMRDIGLKENDNTLFVTACLWIFRSCSREQQLAAIARAAEILGVQSPVLTPEQQRLLKEMGNRIWGTRDTEATAASESGKSHKKRHTA